ncbi:MAG: hypothetical protein IPK97_08450 [Ahniella sp.]|nr:hypothetical protein [Ahniella sp.]
MREPQLLFGLMFLTGFRLCAFPVLQLVALQDRLLAPSAPRALAAKLADCNTVKLLARICYFRRRLSAVRRSR